MLPLWQDWKDVDYHIPVAYEDMLREYKWWLSTRDKRKKRELKKVQEDMDEMIEKQKKTIFITIILNELSRHISINDLNKLFLDEWNRYVALPDGESLYTPEEALELVKNEGYIGLAKTLSEWLLKEDYHIVQGYLKLKGCDMDD